MPRITNWRHESRSPTLAYRNTETGARAVLHRAPDSYRYKWRGVVLVDGYPVWSRGYETKDATSFRDELRERPAPDLSCPGCPNDDVLIGEKAADGAKVQRWYDLPRLWVRSSLTHRLRRRTVSERWVLFFSRARGGGPVLPG